MFLLATSWCHEEEVMVLEIAKNSFPFQGGIIKGSFYYQQFYENFDVINGIIHPEYKTNWKL